MKILPMDIQRQSFGTKFRGFDPEEVRGYLTIVAEEVAAIQGERDRLDHEIQSLKAALEEHRQREVILKNTLLTAQRVPRRSRRTRASRPRTSSRRRSCRATA
jgi:cell division initiation protein